MLNKLVLLPAAVQAALLSMVAIAIAAPDSSIAFHGEMSVSNVTRNADGDFFTITGTDCGPTRCMESSVGTALPAGPGLGNLLAQRPPTGRSAGSGSVPGHGSSCLCQCRADLPTFREDRMACVDRIEECQMVKFSTSEPHIPFIFLPMKGQIIHPSKEIIFSDDKRAVCAVTGAQYLSKTGWTNLRDIVDHDVPFGLYRDEGKTFLKWRGSRELRSRMAGRVLVAHVMCGARGGVGADTGVGGRRELTAPCAPFRIAGSPADLIVDVSSVLFSAGEPVNEIPLPISAGLSLLESLAIGVSVLILAFMYAAGLFFYLHVKKNGAKSNKDVEGSKQAGSSNDGSFPSGPDAARLEMENGLQNVKTNPLLGLESFAANVSSEDSNGGLSDISEGVDDRLDGSLPKPHIISALVHSTRKKSNRFADRLRPAPLQAGEGRGMRSGEPFFRRGGFDFERAPQSEVSIVEASGAFDEDHRTLTSPCDGPVRRKLYFNPVFFETEHLKNPPPAAIEFLIKIREVMSIAKEKMLAKRFIPILPRIPEEEFYHVLDLGWDMPYYPLGRRPSAVSLKRENSRRSHQCTGCPGCADTKSLHEHRLTGIRRSNSCKSCVSEDIKQKIVRKWLDDVPLSNSPNVDTLKMPQKSIAKVHGTPRSVEPKSTNKEEPKVIQISAPSLPISLPSIAMTKSVIQSQINTITASRPRKKMPPPPPPPVQTSTIDNEKSSENTSKSEEEISVPVEVKEKMQAVIQELTACRRIDPIVPKLVEVQHTEFAAPFIPPLIITVQPHFLPPPPEILYLFEEDYLYQKQHPRAITRISQHDNYEADSLERCSQKRRLSLSYDDMNLSTLERRRLEPRRMSFVAMEELEPLKKIHEMNSRLSKSFRDVCPDRSAWVNENIYENTKQATSYVTCSTVTGKTIPKNLVSEVYVNNYASTNNHGSSTELLNADEDDKNNQPGPLTIEVKGSPVFSTKSVQEDFDPDTLDRKPKLKAYNMEEKKRVDKILLKSAGSFKCKNDASEDSVTVMPTESEFSRKVGSLRQIYEERNKLSNKEDDSSIYTAVFDNESTKDFDSEAYSSFTAYMKAPDLIQPGLHISKDKIFIEPKPPLPPKGRKEFTDLYKLAKHSYPTDNSLYRNEDFSISKLGNGFYPRNGEQSPPQMYGRGRNEESFHARRMGRKSARFRNKRNELKKLTKTEDSGYLSTDSNDSRQRSRFVVQIRAAANNSNHGSRNSKRDSGTDTDDFESLCDGMSESGAESIETNSVFFGNFGKSHSDSENMLKKYIEIDDNCNEVGNEGFETFLKKSLNPISQIDSGFQGETIIQSGDSDSEHRSIISIRTGRSSIRSIDQLSDSHCHTVEC